MTPPSPQPLSPTTLLDSSVAVYSTLQGFLYLLGHFPISPLEHKCLKYRNLAVKFAAAIPRPGTMPGME